MSMQKYTPVPIPLSRRMREFRLRFVPVIVFGVVLLVVIYLWDVRVYNPTFTGKVYAEMALITAPETGLIRGMTVREFDRVSAGDTLAMVMSVDTAVVATQIAVLRANIRLMELSQEPLSDWTRNRLDLAGLRLDMVRETVDRSTSSLALEQARREAERMRTLRAQQLASAQELELVELALAQLEAEIAARDKAFDALSAQVAGLESDDTRIAASRGDIIAAAVDVYELEIAALQAALRPVAVRAPFDGVVSKVYYFNESYVPRGEPFIQLESEVATHIIGYLRQPLSVRPEPGMVVQVRSRRTEKAILPGYIEQVGAQAMLFEESVQRPGILETGLPVKIGLGGLEGLKLIPGELVDVVVRR
jgi:membrane fusion protein, multidrug efflux system